jgi:hypothetical protein
MYSSDIVCSIYTLYAANAPTRAHTAVNQRPTTTDLSDNPVVVVDLVGVPTLVLVRCCGW